MALANKSELHRAEFKQTDSNAMHSTTNGANGHEVADEKDALGIYTDRVTGGDLGHRNPDGPAASSHRHGS